MNNPANSKINWTATMGALLSIAVISGRIPEEYQSEILVLFNALAFPAIVLFRTWFTGPRSDKTLSMWVFTLIAVFAVILAAGLLLGQTLSPVG